MEYRSVLGRCAIDLSTLNLPISNEVALEILYRKGFKLVGVDINVLARKCLSTSKWIRNIKFSEAPDKVDCATFTMWLYAQLGIELRRRPIQQLVHGEQVTIENIQYGDLIFVPGTRNFFLNNQTESIGHVGFYTKEGTVIHAGFSRQGLPGCGMEECPLNNFVGSTFYDVRRYVPDLSRLLTLEIPTGKTVFGSDDLKWMILETLTKIKS